MGIDPRTPVIVGVAQRTWRDGGAPEPLDMWEEVARATAADAGAPRALARLDSVRVVNCLSWGYDDPPGRLAERVGAPAGHRSYSGWGGTTPQVLVGAASEAILAGEQDLVLVVGGEALGTKRALKERGERPAWSHRSAEGRGVPADAIPHRSELAHGLVAAFHTFALFDVARRAHLGTDPATYRRELADLLAPMTTIAAGNPHAWFTVPRTADEIATPTRDNRMVGYPYTKRMVAIMDVDMAAALLLASEAAADELRVPRERRVYPRAWAYGEEAPVIAERDALWRSPGVERVARAALAAAGTATADAAHLDLYSCFPSSLHLACDALGVEADGARLTVTGGLPYAGGPANDYVTHAIATVVERLRADPGSTGVVSGVGMHLTKHAYGVYASEPGPVAPVDGAAVQAELDALPRRRLSERATGPATVAAYTLEHDRDGSPTALLAVCDLPDGSRCYARSAEPALLRDAETTELVGAEVGLVDGGEGVNLLGS